jgi:methylamine dehydrogenase heavy chain
MNIRNTISIICLLMTSGLVSAQTFDTPGRSEVLPAEQGPNWVWVAASAGTGGGALKLIDAAADSKQFLGLVSIYGPITPTFSQDKKFVYAPETFWSRGNRGEHTEELSIFDAVTLGHAGEISIPAKRAPSLRAFNLSTLTDEGRFLAIFNLTPATSVTIVDTESRSFVEEIATPGCSLTYAAGERRFLMLCTDGAFLTVNLNEDGSESGKERTESFFDPVADPVTERAVRYGDTWLFVSFEGVVHPLDVSGDKPSPGESWALISDAEKADGWRIAGDQHLAVHQATGRLYSMVRQGGDDTQTDPGAEGGTEVWVYSLASRERVQRIQVYDPETMGPPPSPPDAEEEEDLESGMATIFVTQTDEPLLLTSGKGPGAETIVYDAASGEELRRIGEVAGRFYAP